MIPLGLVAALDNWYLSFAKHRPFFLLDLLNAVYMFRNPP